MNKHKGFVLLEAVAAVVVASICLTLIAQSLLTNLRAGVRFQNAAAALLAMENSMGVVFAGGVPADQGPQPMEKPYAGFSIDASTAEINERLKTVELRISPADAARRRGLAAATIVYASDRTK